VITTLRLLCLCIINSFACIVLYPCKFALLCVCICVVHVCGNGSDEGEGGGEYVYVVVYIFLACARRLVKRGRVQERRVGDW